MSDRRVSGRRGGAVLTGLCLALISVSLYAQENATYWLQRISAAMQHLNYEGTFVYIHDGALESIHIIHGADAEGEHEHLMALSGPAREVIRDKERVTYILPDDMSVLVDKINPRAPFRLQMPTNIEHLNDYYTVASVSDDRVAGMPAQRVVLQPKDNFRYPRIFWLAQQSGLLLRTELQDEQGRVLEQMMFTHLSLHDRFKAERFQAQTDGKGYVWLKNTENDTLSNASSQWHFAQLPAGFVQETQRRYRLANGDGEVEHHIFSDGLSTISVFVEPNKPDADAFIGSSKMGALSAYGLVLDDYRITVMGEVPMLTVKTIAGSIRNQAGK